MQNLGHQQNSLDMLSELRFQSYHVNTSAGKIEFYCGFWVGLQHTTSSGASRGAPHGVANLKARKGAADTLNKGSGALGKVK